jgi:hypothetical protein
MTAARWRRPRTLVALGLVLLVGLLAVTLGRAYGGEVVDRFAEQGPHGTLVELHDLAQFRDVFDDAPAAPRLVLLLSPT